MGPRELYLEGLIDLRTYRHLQGLKLAGRRSPSARRRYRDEERTIIFRTKGRGKSRKAIPMKGRGFDFDYYLGLGRRAKRSIEAANRDFSGYLAKREAERKKKLEEAEKMIREKEAEIARVKAQETLEDIAESQRRQLAVQEERLNAERNVLEIERRRLVRPLRPRKPKNYADVSGLPEKVRREAAAIRRAAETGKTAYYDEDYADDE